MNIEQDYERLKQERIRKEFLSPPSINEFITVKYRDDDGPHYHGISSALIPKRLVADTLNNLSFDIQDGMPGSVESYSKKRKRVKYLRFGELSGVEPLVIERSFHEIKPNYFEISEEFRLFHRLFHDISSNQFFKIQDNGREDLVAIVTPQSVKIRLKEIRQFIAVKNMYMSLLIDYRELSPYQLAQFKLQDESKKSEDDLYHWAFHARDMGGGHEMRAFSRFLGKRLIKPVSKSKSGFWGFAKEEPEKFVSFIIGVDENGEPISFTSDEDKLSNYFGANKGAPNYLTPVHFDKKVLDKYYLYPSRFSVDDSRLTCGNIWGMAMDNHNENFVCTWLGDLGRDLPYEEQLHWLSHNIVPHGTMSETFFRRQILNQFTSSERPEHIFPILYRNLQKACTEKLGWQILLPLSKGDEHHLQEIRVPSTTEQREFDSLVLSLTKILVDSLNEAKLKVLISSKDIPSGGINRLELLLKERDCLDYISYIQFLRYLQSLRSTGTAHRKGEKYQSVLNGGREESQNLIQRFESILLKANLLLEFIENIISNGTFNLVSDSKNDFVQNHDR